MKIRVEIIFLLGALVSAPGVPGHAQQTRARSPIAADSTVPVAPKDDSPAEVRIHSAQRQIQADPRKVQALDDLATAYIRRARETANPGYLEDANHALDQGAQLDPEDFQIKKTKVMLLLAQHRYVEAKQTASLLQRHTPDDGMIYGYLAEAGIALGDYAEAEKSAQWSLNLRPNNVPGLLLAAQLRTLYGDADGALDLLNLASRETSPTETEEQAWILNQIASIQIDEGESDAAESSLQSAEQIFPHYAYTLENMARIRMAQHRSADAAALWLEAKKIDKSPQVLYQLAQAQRAAGQTPPANATVAEFRVAANKETSQPYNANLELVLLDCEDAAKAADALKLAQRETEVRHDVWTWNAYAWALYANGRFQDADVAIRRALDVGIQSAAIFDHAGHIAQKLGNTNDAARYFELSMRTDPTSEYASDARRAMGLPGESATSVAEAPASIEKAALLKRSQAIETPYNHDASETTFALAQPNSLPPFSPVPVALLTPRPTDTERVIHNAQSAITRNSKDAKAYTALGAAYFQRARETGDVNDYELAEQSLNKSLDLVSTDFSADAALGTMAEVCMGEHRFEDALNYSQKALSLGSGDLSSFAIIGDANADMGEYDQARLSYERLNIPGSEGSPRAGYARDSRLSYLNFISGDTTGAMRQMKAAIAEGLQAQLPRENMAWLYYELGEYATQAGDVAAADSAYLAALTVHPGDYRALAGLAKQRANQGRYAEATVLYQKAIAVVPMPIFVGELGDLYKKAGNQAEADKQYRLVEYIGLLGKINQVLHNRDLAIFYADHDYKLAESLELARKELEVRHDIYTWDALAWALYKNGKYEEAGNASARSLQFGTQDSLLLFHAGMIAEKLGQREVARDRLKAALTINPHFHLIYADTAQQRLPMLETQALARRGGAGEHHEGEKNAR